MSHGLSLSHAFLCSLTAPSLYVATKPAATKASLSIPSLSLYMATMIAVRRRQAGSGGGQPDLMEASPIR